MKCELLEGTSKPERLVCKAARNDYQKDWIQEQSFREIMKGSSLDDTIYNQVARENTHLTSVPEEEEPVEHIDKLPEIIELRARKKSLIHHLLSHKHFGPFEHPQFTFAVKGVSRSLMAQLTRHRLATFDIQSMRYVGFDDANPEPGEAVITIPELETVELAGRNAEFADVFKDWSDDEILQKRYEVYESTLKQAFMGYKEMIDLGTAPENARMLLPIGTKVNIVFSCNARILMHIADMRAAADAQWEIRDMTEEVLELAEEQMPITFEYYNENLKNRKNRLAP